MSRSDPLKVKDDGYTCICGHCCKRFGADASLIGRPREFAFSVCDRCIENPPVSCEKRERRKR